MSLPEIVTTIQALNTRLRPERLAEHTIGFVPTMGALHRGHRHLIEQARAHCHTVVVSIFVNPTQFNQASDFALYPRTLEADTQLCADAGADIIFAPNAAEIYPAGLSVGDSAIATVVDVAPLAEHFCGAFRPGHFQGVATVVMKLFQIVRPNLAYFGEKDAQQLAIVRRMVRDLNVPVEIVPVATIREPDGLALSSRNVRLSYDDRQVAQMLHRALLRAAEAIHAGARTADGALAESRQMLAAEPRIRLEYFEVADPDSMQPVSVIERPVLILIAAWLGPPSQEVRLIDNMSAAPAVPA